MSYIANNLETTREMKDSNIEWIGEIPVGWEVGKVKYAFIRKNSKAQQENAIVLRLARSGIQIRNIENNEGQLAESYFNYNPVEVGDLLLNPMDLQSGANCNISYVTGVISPAYINLRAKNGFVARYYDYYFKTQYWAYAFFAHGKGVSFDNRWTLNNETIQNYHIPLPPMHEQQAIASYLDEHVAKIDELIAEQNQAIENWKAYKQSLITETVTKGLNSNVEMKDSGIEWIGVIPKEWNIVTLGEFIDFINGFAFDSGDLILDGDVSVIRISDIQNGTINYESCLKTNNNNFGKSYINNIDILLAMSGGTTGKTAFVEQINQIVATNQRVGIIRLKKNAPKYVYYCLNSKNFKEYVDLLSMGSAQPNISTKSMKTYKITLPPIHEQQAIADFLDEKCSKIDQIINRKQIFIEQLEEYKQSLIYECVTGKRCVEER